MGAGIIFPCLNAFSLSLCKVSAHTDVPVSLELVAKVSVPLSPASSTVPGGIMG